ncbi:hypothetical protein M758_3G058300 [Ceratodon purpureus]|nr:hypothetical protein M758_3G058300 [Ceratodon purpureus]
MEQGPDQLRNWTASLAHKLAADESKEKFTFLTKPQFKCVMCKTEIVSSPVFQCQLGHLACSRCSCRGRRCTRCSKAVSSIKNVAIGGIIDSLHVICKYEYLGCKSTYLLKSYKDHEKVCPFKPMDCPMPDCKHAGVRNSLEQHVKSKHNVTALVSLDPTRWSCRSYPALASFSLDSNINAKVLLQHSDTKDYYLLHQGRTDFGDRLHLTSLSDSGKLKKYEINVEIKLADPKIKVEIKHSYKFESRTDTLDHDRLLIPKHEPGDAPATSKREVSCTIRVNEK